MSAEMAPPPPEGRLVFDRSSEADTEVADRLHDTLFPPEHPTDRRRPLYGHQTGDDSPAGDSGGGDGGSGAGSEGQPEGDGGGSAAPVEPWVEDPAEPLLPDGPLNSPPEDAPVEDETPCEAVLRVLERRQVIRERFARRQATVRDLQRRCGQHPARGAPIWTPPVLVYRPPPLPALQRRLLEPGELADTVPEPSDHTRRQIDEFCRRHLRNVGDEDDTPR